MPGYDQAELGLQMIAPNNVLVYDDKGIPGVYVRLGKHRLCDLLDTDNTAAHPAFITDGAEVDSILVGKYLGSIQNGRMYSLPGKDPGNNFNLDEAFTYARAKGEGHHIITAAEWAFLALWSKKNNTQPLGNNNYGLDDTETSYVAIPSTARDSSGRVQRTATGTGPLTWSHNHEPSGIWDLNGNVWELLADARLVYSELQVIPHNRAALSTTDVSETSVEWKAINAAATDYADLFITPNGTGTTSGSIKLDYINSHWHWDTTATSISTSSRNAAFSLTTCGSNVSTFAKLYLQAMALAPIDNDADYSEDGFYAVNGADSRALARGGGRGARARGGVFALSASNARANRTASIGSRLAYR